MAKVGVLEFRYGNTKPFAERLRRTGSYTINIGDSIQSLAVESLLGEVGVAREEIVRVDRDALPAYRGPPVRLVMNACFFEDSFPLSDRITPLFVGFQTASRELIRAHLDLFRRHEPIGCRDAATRDLFREQGLDAYVTGCLSMTLPLRQERPTTPRAYFVGGEAAGEMPPMLERHVPPEVRRNSVYQHQREAVTSFPLSDADAAAAARTAERLLAAYRREATLVVTPLLHAAGPCLAMGIPVVLARKDLRDRFTSISSVLPVYTPRYFHAIDWEPACPDLEDLKRCVRSLVSDALRGSAPSAEHRRFLAGFYDKDVTPTTALLAFRRPFLARLPIVGRIFGP